MKSESAVAAEHLKVIRQMMERATVYRALSVPAAIVGGLVALGVGGFFIWRARSGVSVSGAEFFWVWVGALVVIGVFNTLFLWRKSRSEGEVFLSPALVHASLAIVPGLFVGGFVSYEAVVAGGDFELGVLVWGSCFGVAMLAMGGVAPRSLRRLGWAFLVAGFLLFLIRQISGGTLADFMGTGEIEAASWMMVATFGFLFLAHGIGVLSRSPSELEPI